MGTTKGSLLIDRIFAGVGRIHRHSGTYDREERKRYLNMLDELYRLDQLDALKGLMNGTLGFKEVFHHFRNHKLNRLISVESVMPVNPVLLDWIASYPDWEENTRDRYRRLAAKLITMKPKGRVTDLPDMLQSYRTVCLKAHHSRQFNQCRMVALSYTSKVFGKSHPLRLKVADVRPLKDVNKRVGHPLHVWEVDELLCRFKTPKYARMLWTLVTTGMGWKEFEGNWEVFGDRVLIHGTKRKSRNRTIPFLGAVKDWETNYCYPSVQERWFRDRLTKASNAEVQIYDLRRTFAFWMVEAGIPEVRQAIYLGHVVQNLEQLYSLHDVTPMLKDDAERLNNYIAQKRTIPKETIVLATTPLLVHRKKKVERKTLPPLKRAG